MDKKYKVQYWQDGDYAVYELMEESGILVDDVWWEKVFSGSLSDCEAYIRLHVNGYM